MSNSRKDPNFAIKVENAISEKYGVETVQHPQKDWTPEKEQDYLEQLKLLNQKLDKISEKLEKVEKISNHVSYTLLYVLPTLPMFLIFPYLINKFGFYWSIIISMLITTFFIFLVHFLTKKFGYKIL